MMNLAEPEVKEIPKDKEPVKTAVPQTVEKPQKISVTGIMTAFQVCIGQENTLHREKLSSSMSRINRCILLPASCFSPAGDAY
jgi:hypothetical protein